MAFIRGKQSDDWLKLTCDRKVSPRGTWQESRQRWIPSVPDSFGLPAGESCPGRTPFCQSCYAVNSEKASGVRSLVDHNLLLLTKAGTVDGMAELLREMLGRYVDEADRVGLRSEERIFRIHWDGDFFSLDYAQAWAVVIAEHPGISFWCYTRSFAAPVDVVPILAGIPNLAVYLSVDRWNHEAAAAHCTTYDVHLAMCDVDYRSARELAPVERKPLVCPENSGRMAIMSDGVGACVECRLCPDGRRDVIFSTTHREVAGRGLTPRPYQRRAPKAPASAPVIPGFLEGPAFGGGVPGDEFVTWLVRRWADDYLQLLDYRDRCDALTAELAARQASGVRSA